MSSKLWFAITYYLIGVAPVSTFTNLLFLLVRLDKTSSFEPLGKEIKLCSTKMSLF